MSESQTRPLTDDDPLLMDFDAWLAAVESTNDTINALATEFSQ